LGPRHGGAETSLLDAGLRRQHIGRQPKEVSMPQDGKRASDDLKAREYRDKDGQIHHHTHPYMKAHGKDGTAGAGRPAKRGRSAESDGRDDSGGTRTTTDHDEIRCWAEDHGGKPAAVKRTHKRGDVGIIRIMFPDAPNSDHDALQEISWDEFFAEFEARDLALVYDQDSLFSKLIGRDSERRRARGDNHAHR
jgi:hypothetical protein